MLHEATSRSKSAATRRMMRWFLAIVRVMQWFLMQSLMLSVGLLITFGAAQRTPFVDVPPCHWAASAISEISGRLDISPEQVRNSNYLAENALRQVFEGLRCGDLEWSARFMTGIPSGATPVGALSGFELRNVVSGISGESATVTFELTAVIDGTTLERSGSAELVFEDARWLVVYASLAALELPLFP